MYRSYDSNINLSYLVSLTKTFLIYVTCATENIETALYQGKSFEKVYEFMYRFIEDYEYSCYSKRLIS